MAKCVMKFRNHGGIHEQKEKTGRKIIDKDTGKQVDEFKIIRYPKGSVITSTIDLEARFGGKFEYLGNVNGGTRPEGVEPLNVRATSRYQITDNPDTVDDGERFVNADTQEAANVTTNTPTTTTNEQQGMPVVIEEDWNSMEVPQLRQYAQDNKISLVGTSSKADIIKAIRAANERTKKK